MPNPIKSTSLYRWYKRKFFKYSQERIDDQFSKNKWDWLESLDELPRYSLLIGHHRYHNSAGSILDLGCGQGYLLKRFSPHDYSSYLAVDFSGAALTSITVNEKVSKAEADICIFNPPKKFDTIIFNESLYYVKNPLQVLKRYFDFLTPNGVILVSIHVKKNFPLIEEIQKSFEVEDYNSVSNRWNETWACITLKKQS